MPGLHRRATKYLPDKTRCHRSIYLRPRWVLSGAAARHDSTRLVHRRLTHLQHSTGKGISKEVPRNSTVRFIAHLAPSRIANRVMNPFLCEKDCSAQSQEEQKRLAHHSIDRVHTRTRTTANLPIPLGPHPISFFVDLVSASAPVRPLLDHCRLPHSGFSFRPTVANVRRTRLDHFNKLHSKFVACLLTCYFANYGIPSSE